MAWWWCVSRPEPCIYSYIIVSSSCSTTTATSIILLYSVKWWNASDYISNAWYGSCSTTNCQRVEGCHLMTIKHTHIWVHWIDKTLRSACFEQYTLSNISKHYVLAVTVEWYAPHPRKVASSSQGSQYPLSAVVSVHTPEHMQQQHCQYEIRANSTCKCVIH
jgi:hypothetical protein